MPYAKNKYMKTREEHEQVPLISPQQMFLDYKCHLCKSNKMAYQKILARTIGSWHYRNNIIWVVKCNNCNGTIAYVQEPQTVTLAK